MSVSSGLNRVTVLSCLVAVSLVAAAAGTGSGSGDAPDVRPASGTQVREARTSLDVVVATSPAERAIEVSRRLFATAPVAVLADPDDRAARRVATSTASRLHAPLLLVSAAAPAEIRRLDASVVLTFGATQDVPGARAVPVDEAGAAAEADRVGGDHPAPPRSGAVVLTTSAAAATDRDAVAVANARTAGAQVLELPDADPRTSPEAVAYLREHPDAPVIALGRRFARVAYPLDVVRRGVQQPTGGYLALGGRTYTAMYGHPGAPQLGVLGEQGVRASIARVERLARKYRRVSSSTFVPTFEIIATVASSSPGKDKDYSTETPVSRLRPLVDAARKAGVYVVLDLQPGRTDFLTQAKRYRSLLEEPHVGLALDPEWRLRRTQKHLAQIGSVGAAEIDRTADWLAAVTRKKSLPQKIFVLHQFSLSMIRDRDELDTSHPELATVIHVDGSGPQGAKQDTWRTLRRGAPKGVGWGWKNFVDEDSPMLDARQTWRQVRPHPDLITYQ